MTEKLTRETATALVDLIRAVRPAWDARATLDTLAEIRDKGDIAFVAYRCLKAAQDPAAATPKALTFDQYWTEPDRLRTITPPQPPRIRPGEFARDPAPGDRGTALLAQARQAIRDNPPPTTKQPKEGS